MASSLSSYSRQLTMSNRSRRNLYRIAGLSPTAWDRLFSVLMTLAFLICFLIPFVGAAVYFSTIATPQYESETRFVIRSAAPLLTRDRFSSATAEPEAKIVQDTQIVVNYLATPEIVARLDQEVGLHAVYGEEDVDYLSRLAPDASREDLLDYWETRHEAEVNPKSGIVELTVAAFSPEEALLVLNAVLGFAEDRVNRLNAGIWDSLRQSAEQDVEMASQVLETQRLRLQEIQDQTGVFSVDLEAEGLSEIRRQVDSEIAQLKSEREALSATLAPNAPALRRLDRRIKARERQSADLRARGAGGAERDKKARETLSEQARKFEAAQLEIEIAETRFRDAVDELEKVKLVSSLQLVYLDRFTEPTLAEDSTRPNVPLAIFLSLLAALAAWGVVGGGLFILREKLD